MSLPIPQRPWAQMSDQELARELRLLPHDAFVSRLIKAVDELQTVNQTLLLIRQRLTPTG